MVRIEIMPWCKGCPICYEVCPAPTNVFELEDGKPVVAHPEFCFACGLCSDLCPVKAIVLTDHKEPFRLPFSESLKALAKKVI